MHTNRPTRVYPIATGIATVTTSVPVEIRAVGFKTLYAEVKGTGAVSASVDVYGCLGPTAAGPIKLTDTPITLSGTNNAQDAVGGMTASYPYYYISVLAISGTDAKVNAYILH